MNSTSSAISSNVRLDFDVDRSALRTEYLLGVIFASLLVFVWIAYALMLFKQIDTRDGWDLSKKFAVSFGLWIPFAVLLRGAQSARNTLISVERIAQEMVFALSDGSTVRCPREKVMEAKLGSTRITRVTGRGKPTQCAVIQLAKRTVFIERAWFDAIARLAAMK